MKEKAMICAQDVHFRYLPEMPFAVDGVNMQIQKGEFVAVLGAMGFGAANAYALMVFCLLYVPCTATIATIHREVGSAKITAANVLFQLAVAWVVSFIAFHVAGLFI